MNDSRTNVFTPDIPLEDEKDDLFHSSELVDVLIDTIKSITPPFSIALSGRWGSGKSTIINFLKKRIKIDIKNSRFIIIDVWKFSPEYINQELLLEINRNLKPKKQKELEGKLWNTQIENKSKRGFMQFMKKYIVPFLFFIGLIITIIIPDALPFEDDIHNHIIQVLILSIPFLIFLIKNETMIKTSKPAFSYQFKELFKDMTYDEKSSKLIIVIKKLIIDIKNLFKDITYDEKSSKLIIVIDNLDRCDSKTVIDILGALKTFMEQENCIYIIPCDMNALTKHVKDLMNVDEQNAIEFLSKFFQMTLHIPSQIEDDLENYVDKHLASFPKIINKGGIKDVLLLSIFGNPRKLKQYLYNILILYELALRRESNNRIPQGSITNNIGFLAKIVVIRDEWPNFYHKLEIQENLLDLAYDYLDNPGSSLSNNPDHEIIKDKYDLQDFLRNTNLIKSENIRPFLGLNQSYYENNLPDLKKFILHVTKGDSTYIQSFLSDLSDDKASSYISAISEQIKSFNKTRRYQAIFNSLKVLLEIYEQISTTLQPEIFSIIESNVQNQEIKNDIYKFDVNTLFPLIMNMPTRTSDQLFKEYSNNLTIDYDEKLFTVFINNIKQLSDTVKKSLDNGIANISEKDPKRFLNIIEKISDNENTISILRHQTSIKHFIDIILSNSQYTTDQYFDLYFKIKHLFKNDNKTLFINKLFSSIPQFNDDAVNAPSFKYLQRLNTSDFTAQASNQIFEQIKISIHTLNDPIRVLILKIFFKTLPHFNSANSDYFMTILIKQIKENPNLQFLEDLYRIAADNKIDIFDYNDFFDTTLEQMGKSPINQFILECLMQKSPDRYHNKTMEMILQRIEIIDTSNLDSILTFCREHYKLFSLSDSKRICNDCIQNIKNIDWNTDSLSLSIISCLFNNCAQITKVEFIKILPLWVNKLDINQFSQAIEILRETLDKMSKTDVTDLAKNISSLIVKDTKPNNPKLGPILNFLIEISTKMKTYTILYECFEDVFSNNNEQAHIIALSYLQDIQPTKEIQSLLPKIYDLHERINQSTVKEDSKKTLIHLQQFASQSLKKKINKLSSDSTGSEIN